MPVKLTVNLPQDIEIEERTLGGVLFMLFMEDLSLKNPDINNLITDNSGNVYLFATDSTFAVQIVNNNRTKAALVDAMNALIHGEVKKVPESYKFQVQEALKDDLLKDEVRR